MLRTLSVVLAVLLTTACAIHRTSIPNWERYKQGELVGFLRAPGEQVVSSGHASRPLQRARGQVEVLSSTSRSGPRGGRIDVSLLPPKAHDDSGVVVQPLTPIRQPSAIGFEPDGIHSDPEEERARLGVADLSSGPTPARRDRTLVVVELRGPGESGEVRTLATRDGVFDFGPLPDGVYMLKATMRASTIVGTLTVSDFADPKAWIRIGLWRQRR